MRIVGELTVALLTSRGDRLSRGEDRMLVITWSGRVRRRTAGSRLLLLLLLLHRAVGSMLQLLRRTVGSGQKLM